MVPGAGPGGPVPLRARTAELRGPAHRLPRSPSNYAQVPLMTEGDRPVRRFLGGRVQYGKNSLLSEKEASESSHYVASSVRKTHI